MADETQRGRLQSGAESWAQATVASGELVQEITRLKAMDGKPMLAHGGATFARSLIAHNLVDEYVLLVYPIALGRGLPIFSDLPAPRPAGQIENISPGRNGAGLPPGLKARAKKLAEQS